MWRIRFPIFLCLALFLWTALYAREQPGTDRLPEGVRLGEGDILEVYVDLKGQIYKRRRYQGVIPRFNDVPAFTGPMRDHMNQQGTKPRVLWVGFQQLAAASRIFVKTDRVAVYTLYKPDAKHIVLEFPDATVPIKNTHRELLTEHFNSPVKQVRILEQANKHRVKVVVDLKESVGYIYRQDGNYVYIDIER
jgi:hypothetical protein